MLIYPGGTNACSSQRRILLLRLMLDSLPQRLWLPYDMGRRSRWYASAPAPEYRACKCESSVQHLLVYLGQSGWQKN